MSENSKDPGKSCVLRSAASNVAVRLPPELEVAWEDTVGFQHVDAHVTDVMTTWIGKVVEQTCRELLASNHNH